MVAVYPSAIKTFAYRQDFTELVEAADVNVAYEEIRALQTTLGVNPNKEIIDGKQYSWTDVNSRIASVRTGLANPFVSVAAHNFEIAYAAEDAAVSWTNRTMDTNHMWGGGSAVTCPRSGVYNFEIFMRWRQDNLPHDNQQPVFNRNGELKIGLTAVGSAPYLVAESGFYPIGWQKATYQSASITAPWTKGTGVKMYVRQDCYTTNLIGTAFCAITYLRDPPGLPFNTQTIIGL